MMSEPSLEQLCGQLLVCGFDGDTLPSQLTDPLERRERGGVILFRRNLPNRGALVSITGALGRFRPEGMPIWVGIDEEGGRVSRLPDPFPRLPPMRTLGRLGDINLVERAGAALGQLLFVLQINLDFAPVLDVDSNPLNPVIGDRAFSTAPELVAELGLAFARGLGKAGIMACGKHYPGHGDTLLDSHLALPRVILNEARLRETELAPFEAAARAQLPTLMTAHVVYEALDERPATLSYRLATELLRGELGFRGVLFSDDLEMKAVANQFPIEELAVQAVSAGCDALLICHSADLQDRAHRALVQAASDYPAFELRCREAAARCSDARSSLPTPTLADPGAVDEAAKQLADVCTEIDIRHRQLI